MVESLENHRGSLEQMNSQSPEEDQIEAGASVYSPVKIFELESLAEGNASTSRLDWMHFGGGLLTGGVGPGI